METSIPMGMEVFVWSSSMMSGRFVYHFMQMIQGRITCTGKME